MSDRPVPSPQRQFLFIVLFGVLLALLIYVLTFFFPRAAPPMWYLEGWAFLVAGVFWLVDRTVRKLCAARQAKTGTP